MRCWDEEAGGEGGEASIILEGVALNCGYTLHFYFYPVWYEQSNQHYVDGLVQERRNSIANALELRLSCTNPSMWLCVYVLSIHIQII